MCGRIREEGTNISSPLSNLHVDFLPRGTRISLNTSSFTSCYLLSFEPQIWSQSIITTKGNPYRLPLFCNDSRGWYFTEIKRNRILPFGSFSSWLSHVLLCILFSHLLNSGSALDVSPLLLFNFPCPSS